MKKILSFIAVCLAVFTFAVLASSCGATLTDEDCFSGDSAKENTSLTISENGIAKDIFSDASASDEAQNVTSNRKVIEYLTFDIQTKEYSVFITSLENEIAKIGAYVEKSEIYGSGLDYAQDRSASLVVRVPCEKTESFTDFISENCTVTSKIKTSDDVTLEYVDTESRISALKAEKEALEKMLADAETVDDTIKIRDSLSNVISEIESYESRLRTIDSLIEYTTVTLNIWEVERTVPKTEIGIWEEIENNVNDNFASIVNFFVSVFVFSASAIPYIIIVVIIVLAVLIAVKCNKVKKAKKAKKQYGRSNVDGDPNNL